MEIFTHHGHNLAGILQLLHIVRLLGGKHLGSNIIDASKSTDGFGSATEIKIREKNDAYART